MAAPDPNLTLAVVFESTDPVALSVAKAGLEEAGIEFAIVEEALQGYGFSPVINPVSRIQVAQTSEAQARDLIVGLLVPLESGGDGETAPPEGDAAGALSPGDEATRHET